MLVRALALLVLTFVAAWPVLGIEDWHGTEGRRVQIAREMVVSGDFMVPTLGFSPTWAKPPLHYWLLAAAERVFGDGYVAARLPSVLGWWLLALLGGELLRRRFGAPAGWVCALGVVTAPVYLFELPTAEIDPLFACFTAASLWCLAAGIAGERKALVFAGGVLGGLAVLHKGPPYFLFALGAWLVWWRHRRFRHGLPYFMPLLLVPLAYYVPLWATRIAPDVMLQVASDESIGRMFLFEWKHVATTPYFWLRAAAVQFPLVLWCFWEWRSDRDARMSPPDLLLRMCSGAAVISVVLLTFFPGRPTRYLLPNVALFVFAVSPAVAHFASQQRQLGNFARGALRAVGLAGAAALLAVPFVPASFLGGAAALGLAAGLLPFAVRTPRQLVAACFWLPLVAAWTVGLARADHWPDSRRARAVHGPLLVAETLALDPLATKYLATTGHVNSSVLLGADLVGKGVKVAGDESGRTPPGTPFVLREATAVESADALPGYAERVRFCLPGLRLAVEERTGPR